MGFARRHAQSPLWPLLALALAVAMHAAGDRIAAGGLELDAAASALAIAVMLPTVLLALHHAEGVAARIGQPYGTLLLTLAVTLIEVAIIVSVMLHGSNNPTLARESVFAVIMLVCSGGVGLCLTLGAWRFRVQGHRTQGTSTYLAVMIALSVLTLVMPNYTEGAAHGEFSAKQVAFVGALSVLLYAAFVYMQSSRHRADFIDEQVVAAAPPETPVSLPAGLVSLIAGLTAVVLLAERVAAGVEDGLDALGVGNADAIIGVLIAAMLLFPEMLSAVRATLRDELQRSLNIMLGSALATIALTIPAVAFVSIFTGRETTLGLEPREQVLLALTLTLSIVSFGTGRTNLMTGMVHLVVFFAWLWLLVI